MILIVVIKFSFVFAFKQLTTISMFFQPAFSGKFPITTACKHFESKSSCYDWALSVGLIKPILKCPKQPSHLINICVRDDKYYFICRRKGHAVFKKSALSNTWFERHKLPMNEVMFITYFYCFRFTYENISYHMSRKDGTTVSTETISDIFSFIREVIKICMQKEWEQSGKLGQHSTRVQIDETKIGKQKYRRGRMVDGSWVFGAVDEDGQLRLEVIEDNKRSSDRMLEYINKHVSKEAVIASDCARFYSKIKEDGFKDHLVVNHSVEYVTEDGVYTNRIESHWRALKAFIGTGRIKETMEEHLYDYLFDLHCRRNNIDKFALLITFISHVYCG